MTDLSIGDQITTIDQLETLPVGAVIHTDMARVAVKAFMADDEGPAEWFETGDFTSLRTDELCEFPATLLYLGSRP